MRELLIDGEMWRIDLGGITGETRGPVFSLVSDPCVTTTGGCSLSPDATDSEAVANFRAAVRRSFVVDGYRVYVQYIKLQRERGMIEFKGFENRPHELSPGQTLGGLTLKELAAIYHALS